ncbi:E3 ubiquitin ligase [Phytophthora cinnamomi]|uniref:E3 ubiquitin ligase n=1 Tax=Phytophthora cinnamomi TaxID=4785 RepID=UPI00355A7C3C|nr:E3 ubiquitin ligase [Phytophthora cinnamomi]
MNGYFVPEPHQKPAHADEMDGPNCKTYTLKMLRQCAGSELPLRVKVTSTKADEGHAVYHFTTTSVTSMNTWRASYRYSEFLAFRNQGLGILSTWAHTVEDRKLKFKNVLIHLLRSVLLPGSTMKCFHARRNLPKHLFKFLGVEADADKRTLLQVYVDNHQGGIKKSATTADLSKLEHKSSMKKSATTSDLASMSAVVPAIAPNEPSQCMVCLEDVGLNVDSEHAESDDAPVELQCKHKFHRKCIFEWLTFQYHCPVCRGQVGPSAMTNYCRPKNQVQWWLGNFSEDPLKPETE